MAPIELHQDEEAVTSEGVPLLLRAHRGDDGQPVAVFLPGAIHLARISYGHDGSNPTDFLAHWFAERGWSFIAVSYPLELVAPAFEVVDPNLGMAAYSRAVARVVDHRCGDWGLTSRIVVLGWSAAGNMVPRLGVDLAALGRSLSLFVGLAATPAIPDLIFGALDGTRAWAESPSAFTANGLLAHAGIRSFQAELDWTDERYGRVVIPAEVYNRSYVGNMALNLFPGLGVRRSSDGARTVGHDQPLSESLGTNWGLYPMVANLQPTWPLDDRHAVTDKWNWSMVLTNMLSRRWTPTVAAQLSSAAWTELTGVVNEAPERLHQVIEGGHMFFVGEDGARQTVDTVAEMLSAASEISTRVDELLANG